VTVGEFSMNVANSLVIYYTHVDLLKTEPIAVGRIFLAHALEGPLRGNVKRAGAPIQVEHNAVSCPERGNAPVEGPQIELSPSGRLLGL